MPRVKDDRINKIGETYLLDPQNEITLSEWAERLSFSQRTLIRKIKKETGMTFREYRRQARILASIGLLFEDQNITNTGLDVGFNTTSSFIQSFKTVTGTTPYKYIKSKT
ncbi:MAG: helix-turn-helix transcriptional regulator [Rhizobiales bacterium]|nr:helix-turn-helix transcriptional regulator [Hyphomicrobiales bacterium]